MSRPATTDKSDEIGTLIVILLKARNLNDKHTVRKQDAYAQASLNGVVKKSKIEVKAGQHPVWDEEVRFPVMKSTSAKHRKLEVACYAKEPRTDDLLGKAVVDITETLKTGEFDEWVSLDIDGVVRGEIYLEMTYFSNAPTPAPNQKPASAPNKHLLAVQGNNLQRRPSKLSPNERLSRPNANPQLTSLLTEPTSHKPTADKPLPSPLAPSRPGPLSPGPGPGLPSSLTPASTRPTRLSESLPATQPLGANPAPLPTILRPGVGSPTPIPQGRPQGLGAGHQRHPSSSPPSQGWHGPSSPGSTSPIGLNPYINPTPAPSSPPNNPVQLNPYISPSPPGGSPQILPANLQPGLGHISPYHGVETLPPRSNIPSLSPFSPPPAGGRSDTPLIWQASNITVTAPTPGTGGFIFPEAAPALHPSGPAPYAGAGQSGYYPPSSYYDNPPNQGQYYNHGAPHRVASVEYDNYGRDARPDPHLIARYQTPLPLPPGASKPPPATPAATSTAPLPAPPAPVQVPVTPKVEPQRTSPAPDPQRVERLRWAEEDARRRREQEQKDLELALQLDRELNL